MSLDKIIKKDASKFIEEGLLDYSSYIALNRALPSVEDGMKPIQRKILWAMWQMKATNFTKSANVSGEVFKYSPHGDSYMSLLPITQVDSISLPLITGKGNWASRTSRDLMPASSRYTECKLSPFSIETMKSIANGGAQMIDNYDGSKKMPKHLPFDIPFVLLSANQGIGMGLASNTFSYNINEVCDATLAYLKGEEIPVLIPDFPTGGEIAEDYKVFSSIMKTGLGGISLYPKVEVSGQTISITEIPYYTTREQLIEAVLKKVKDKTFPEIKEVLDLCGLAGFLVEIEVKRGYDAQKVLDKLFSSGLLTTKASSNSMMLGLNGKPSVHGVEKIIQDWVIFKIKSVKDELSLEKSKINSELIKMVALEKIIPDIDEFINIIRKTSPDILIKSISKKYQISDEQSSFLIKLPLSQLNQGNLEKKIVEIETLKSRVEQIDSYTDEDVKGLISGRVENIKTQYGSARKTKVVSARAVARKVGSRSQKQKEAPENCYAFFTKQGFLTKLPESSKVSTIKLGPGDEVVNSGVVKAGSYIVSFDGGSVSKTYVDDIKFGKNTDLGTFVSSSPSVLVQEDLVSILILFEDGRVLNLAKSVFDTASKRKVLKGFSDKKISSIRPIFSLDDEITLKSNKVAYSMKASDFRLSTGKSGGGAYPKSRKDIIEMF